ncbi:PD-(D/E)XK nuclease family protein [Methylobacterium sp. 391_Methyba4]|uniref:PD-(D/E)XK nuclease family protein n=1 Tax=Methylobacterium sp. 391_Methyba4 TaxID=3038924 RepID=UPI00241F61D2|nr:PD-(D/E)XK nuclease family protein [Methylobacterium sp. 391_Methyba4]WFS09605.1 PD-(D/E)XK nuclease family protein [Methylobacterium sp. 391_Methyba4]
MRIARKRPDRIVPEYSLTGDLLSFRRCARQYRYQNGSALPPSRPVQLWYGEFIHGLLENVYRLCKSEGGLPFPLPYTRLNLSDRIEKPPEGLAAFDLRNLGWPVEESLLNQNKRARSRKARLAAYRRAEAAVNMLGPHLFPLIAEAEERVIGTRDIPGAIANAHRAEKYALTGVIDVLTELELGTAPTDNLIRQAVQARCPNLAGEFEVIVDYKGTRRPDNDTREWRDGEWQVQTYAWLRHEQRRSRRVAAGILIYVNELAPGEGDVLALKAALGKDRTDVGPVFDSDRRMLENWRPGARADFSPSFLLSRAVRVVPVDDMSIEEATGAFDDTVARIEDCVRREDEAVSILQTWVDDCRDGKTCAACDFRYFCEGYQRNGNVIGEEDRLEDEI